MDNFEYVCKITLEKAINDIKSLQEFQNYTINKIKEGLLKETNSWEGIMVKGNSNPIDISLEGNKDIYDQNNNIIPQIIDFDINDKNYLCAVIEKDCFDNDGSIRIPLCLRYLCSKEEYKMDPNKSVFYLFSDNYFNSYYYKKYPTNNSLFTNTDVEHIKEIIYKKLSDKYVLIIIDKRVYSKNSIINRTFSLFNEDTSKYLINIETKNPLFYNELIPDDKPITTDSYNLKQTFMFDQALFLYYKLLRCSKNKWKILEVKYE